MGKDGKMRTLRKGTNGFTCMPDNPATPGPDPMCMDKNSMEWVGAWVAHKPPPAGKVGFMYMLSGGTDASNTDRYAKAPNGEQPLGQDRATHHDRRSGRRVRRPISEGRRPGHLGAVCHVGEYADSALDGAGEMT